MKILPQKRKNQESTWIFIKRAKSAHFRILYAHDSWLKHPDFPLITVLLKWQYMQHCANIVDASRATCLHLISWYSVCALKQKNPQKNQTWNSNIVNLFNVEPADELDNI